MAFSKRTYSPVPTTADTRGVPGIVRGEDRAGIA
jgi:hypothetical protein